MLVNNLLILTSLVLVNAEFDAPASDQLTGGYTYCEAGLPNPETYKPLFKDGKLITTIWMGRHGDRTPINYLPQGHEKDAWNCALEQTHVHNVTFVQSTKYFKNSCNPADSPFNYCSLNPYSSLYWPGSCSTGQLTPKGMAYQFKLGQNLNKIYIEQLKFLNKDWHSAKKDVFVRATDVWRTHQSAISLMSGMFPYNYNQQFTPQQFKKYELPIYSLPTETEYILPNPKNCPNLANLELKVRESVPMQKLLNQTLVDRKNFLSIVVDSNTTKRVEYAKAYDFAYFTDILQARTCHKMPAICNLKDGSKCVTQEIIDNTMVAGNTQYRLLFRDNEHQFPSLAKLRMGAFLLEMKRTLLSHVAKNIDSKKLVDYNHSSIKQMGELKKLYYYSAHDTSIIPLLGAINATDMRWPPYSSNMQFELWKKDCTSKDLDQFHLRAFYNGNPLITSWCNGTCKLTSFLNFLDKKLNLIGGFEAYLEESITSKPFNLVEECFKDVITTPNPNGTS
ncbi:phosphoglycerate mutase-like protein [Neoconidiobolus thromboides FSU 785]|nr:phosphoglycerate mutase-like protein [Neoconidiobolus thromboides FSU 785]